MKTGLHMVLFEVETAASRIDLAAVVPEGSPLVIGGDVRAFARQNGKRDTDRLRRRLVERAAADVARIRQLDLAEIEAMMPAAAPRG